MEGRYNIAITRFLRKYDVWKNDLDHYYNRGKSAQKIVYDILYAAYHTRWNSDLEKIVDQLSKSASIYDSLGEFFSTIRLEGDVVIEGDSISMNSYVSNVPGTTSYSTVTDDFNQAASGEVTIWVMAMQAAKGLEFDEVILPHWVDGNVPKVHSNSPEERRLAFVSLTRAKKSVVITYSKLRYEKKQNSRESKELNPSPFIQEILEIQDPATTFEEITVSSANGFINAIEVASDKLPYVRIDGTPGVSQIASNEFSNDVKTATTTIAKSNSMHSHISPSAIAAMANNEQAGTDLTGENQLSVDSIELLSSPKLPSVVTKEPKTVRSVRSADNVDFKNEMPLLSSRNISNLPDPSSITKAEVKDLITSKRSIRKDLVQFFRNILLLHGIKRGSIPVSNTTSKKVVDGSKEANSPTKPISKCTAEQLGTYLINFILKR